MVRKSNAAIGALNVLTVLLGLAAVISAVYIGVRGERASDCLRFLRQPLLIGGVLTAVVSTLGIVGSLGRVNVAMYIYLLVMLVLILGLFSLTIFALFVTSKSAGHKAWRKYKVTDFSHWLQRNMIDDYRRWNQVKSCVMEAHVCRNLAVDDGDPGNNAKIFRHLSATQSGCCKPPVYCGYRMKNASFWEVPKTGAEVEDSDCRRWSNTESKLCYDCKSCKRGVLADTRQHHWRPFTVIIAIAIVVVSIMYTLGCYTLWSNRSNTQLITNGSRYPPPSHSPIHPP